MKTFRLISLLEGVSLYVLLAIAMPLKYLYGIDGVVPIVGILHGSLFLIYAVATLVVSHHQHWSVLKWLGIFLAGVIPFGFLVIGPRLRAEKWLDSSQDDSKLFFTTHHK